VQTQENEFSFSHEEAHTVAKELEEDIRKHKEDEWEINGGMRFVDTSSQELAIQNSLRTMNPPSFESPTQLYSVSTPRLHFSISYEIKSILTHTQESPTQTLSQYVSYQMKIHFI
jgi:hypothetical protein